MKRNLKILIFTAFLAISPVLLFAQTPPHPNGGNAPTTGTNNKVGEGAAVGDGIFVLLTLAIAYAGRKLYELKTVKEE